jgi:regulator of chromosome condensation
MAKGKGRAPKAAAKVVDKTPAAAIVDSDAPPPKRAKKSNATLLPVPSLPKKSGNALACGQNDVGQLGFLPDDVPEKTRPALVTDMKDIVDVKAGGMHSLCLTKNGEIWSFGCNDEGALGRDTSEEGSETKPSKIVLPKKAVRISCGDSHSACLLEDGSVYAWGSFRDAHGSMGLTTEGTKQSPVRVLDEISAVDIASGSDHFVVLANNGKVFTIGCGEQGQLGRASMRTLTGESRRGKTTLLTPGIISKKAKHFKADKIWATPYCTFLREAKTGEIYGFGLNNYNQICVKKGKNEFEHFPVLTKIKNVKVKLYNRSLF